MGAATAASATLPCRPALQTGRHRLLGAQRHHAPLSPVSRHRSVRVRADGSRTLEPAAREPAARQDTLEEAQSRLEKALETYKYERAKERRNEDVPTAMQRKLEAIGRELATVTPEEYARLSSASHLPSSTVAATPQLQIGSPAAPQLGPANSNIVPLKLGSRTLEKEVRPEGTGEEILLQGFNWDSWTQKEGWWNHIASQAEEIARLGVTTIWLPPPTDSVSPQGYMPGDLYKLNSKYGSEADLKRCVSALQAQGIKVLADAVLNHRCAQRQDESGTWNLYGGRLAWDQRAIVGDDPHFRGRGNRSSGDVFSAAPNLDHSQDFVKRDLCEWMAWLRSHVGFDGFRLDFVKGFHGSHVKDYMAASLPQFAVGEYWDTMSYEWDGSPCHNQDAHRQRTINWINAAGGLATAFDITTKGIMHTTFERCEYWRLRDNQGKPPGLLGWWPSRAVTFLENHDTGSSQGHWRFPAHALEQGYCYILTHPGTPCIFYDHLFHNDHLRHVVQRLVELRKRHGIHCRSSIKILRADRDVYAAEIEEKLVAKIGPGDFCPDPAIYTVVDSGPAWCVWSRK